MKSVFLLPFRPPMSSLRCCRNTFLIELSHPSTDARKGSVGSSPYHFMHSGLSSIAEVAGPVNPTLQQHIFVYHSEPQLDLYILKVVQSVSVTSCARLCISEQACMAFKVRDKLGFYCCSDICHTCSTAVWQGSHTVQKWFLWNHTMTFQHHWLRKELCAWTGTLFCKGRTHFCQMPAQTSSLLSTELKKCWTRTRSEARSCESRNISSSSSSLCRLVQFLLCWVGMELRSMWLNCGWSTQSVNQNCFSVWLFSGWHWVWSRASNLHVVPDICNFTPASSSSNLWAVRCPGFYHWSLTKCVFFLSE